MRTACLLCAVIVTALGNDRLRADDDNDRRARVALALAGVCPPGCDCEQRVTAALARTAPGACQCEQTGICHCDFGACPCCAAGLPPALVQLAEARAKRVPCVVYYGCRGQCAAGALAGQSREPSPDGSPVVVYAPVTWLGGPTNWPVAELPADATREQIAAAVAKARTYLDRFYAPRPAPVSLPAVVAPYTLAAPDSPSCAGGRCPTSGGFFMAYPQFPQR